MALTLILLTALELGHARPSAEYRQKAPNLLYDDYGPVLRRLGIDDGRYVSVAGAPANPRQRDTIPVPAGMSGLTRDYYLAGAATRVAATPGTPLAVGAQTVVGRDGGLLPLRRYREFYDAAAGGGDLAGGAVFAPPSAWDWDTLDYLGVRWFLSSDDLPEAERSVLDAKGFRLADRYAYVLVWRHPPRPLARLVHAVDVVPDRAARLARLAAGYPLGRRAIVERPVALDPPPLAGRRPCGRPTSANGPSSWRRPRRPVPCSRWPTRGTRSGG
ncbi:MAG TPA: hypothetical protein VKP11_07585 [Frankiaceae bacterium]|nr:hypothetical protein [Frankiaceae bacterium]